MSQVVFLSHSFQFLMIIWRKSYCYVFSFSCSCFFVELVVSDEILCTSEEQTALFNVISVFAVSMPLNDYYICLWKGQSKNRIFCVALLHLEGQFGNLFKSNLDHELLSLAFGWYSVQDVLLPVQCHLHLANLLVVGYLISGWNSVIKTMKSMRLPTDECHQFLLCHLTIDLGPVIILIMILALNGFTLFQVRKPWFLDHIIMKRFSWVMQMTWHIFALIVLLPLLPLHVATVVVKHFTAFFSIKFFLQAESAEWSLLCGILERNFRPTATNAFLMRYYMFAGEGTGLLRLHSTYRHDLKIYSSDEGRVQVYP